MIMTHKAGFLAACNDKAVKDSEMNDRITQIIALNFCEEEKALYQNASEKQALERQLPPGVHAMGDDALITF
jgi:hypothetical protein